MSPLFELHTRPVISKFDNEAALAVTECLTECMIAVADAVGIESFFFFGPDAHTVQHSHLLDRHQDQKIIITH